MEAQKRFQLLAWNPKTEHLSCCAGGADTTHGIVASDPTAPLEPSRQFMIVMEMTGSRQLGLAFLGAHLQNVPEGTLWKTSGKLPLSR